MARPEFYVDVFLNMCNSITIQNQGGCPCPYIWGFFVNRGRFPEMPGYREVRGGPLVRGYISGFFMGIIQN
ncbi:MAG TPA: hypothetical protein DCR95_09250 [Desulfobacter sp.]|nr:hypothetical protein [Desulfobacter sp.]